uniref:G_PROTEIN_RECEP_F1_2 domain-containing protein n=1 Tax=Bursaphelenchus xylophilus TaxID=6326 RepID=A0A1I7RIK1_BURXY
MDENRTLALNATLAAKVADAEAQQYVLQLWISVSQFLWWMILVISGLTVPTLVYALYTMLTKYKKSNYFHFLAPMIILDLINLTTVICNLFSDSYKFMNVAAKSRMSSIPVSIKIQSEEGMKAAHRRRRQAIRRCLVLATTQLLLNMPNYVLQVVDEFTGLRGKNGDMAIMYLYADAFLYGLYMLQFPILAVFVRLLHSNYKSRSKNRSTRRTQTNTETVTVELTRHTNGSIDSTARRESQICVCTETSLA